MTDHGTACSATVNGICRGDRLTADERRQGFSFCWVTLRFTQPANLPKAIEVIRILPGSQNIDSNFEHEQTG